MSKIAVLSILATLASGAALASERTLVEPTAPLSVNEVGAYGTVTIAGTVLEVGRNGHFVLADADDGTFRVDAEHLRLNGLAPGQAITVTGSLDRDELEAGHAVRDDGSVASRLEQSDDLD
jgi:hypothetical protein